MKKLTEEHRKHLSESHMGQVPWNKGLTKEIDKRLEMKPETKKKLSEKRGIKNPNYGKHHSEETKKKQSESHKGQIVSLSTRIAVSKAHKGIPRSEETRRKISQSSLGKVMSEEAIKNFSLSHIGQVPWIAGKKHTKEAKQKCREARLKQILPKKDTKIELLIQDELNKRNIIYEKHISVCNCCQPDIVFSEKKIVIFCDGDYWHNLPNYIVRDKKQNEILEENNWKVYRFWEHDILNNTSKCIDNIIELI